MKMLMKNNNSSAHQCWSRIACFFAMLLCQAASASEMVYTPVNPSFGGNPNNAPGLLAVAQAQNGHKAPTRSSLETFNNNLQNAILSRLSSETITTMFGRNSSLVPGFYDTANYTIKVTDSGGGVLTIETTDKLTGATATFTVSTATLDQ